MDIGDREQRVDAKSDKSSTEEHQVGGSSDEGGDGVPNVAISVTLELGLLCGLSCNPWHDFVNVRSLSHDFVAEEDGGEAGSFGSLTSRLQVVDEVDESVLENDEPHGGAELDLCLADRLILLPPLITISPE